ncbi:MAG: helix-turn-helix domain-containing protein [Dorea formicigenerans]|uniref:winged helix-turn-helix domain-containing protein n=1 Tax=Dorea sp. AGR2135 TaxID=1280669 RepID=UPI00041BFDDA|nr:helix-turn-helix domain-containing protein [Dorea sp. AGR2135]
MNEREIAFLYLLADAPKQVVKHEIIFERLWREPYGVDSANMIWCFVRRLRKKLEKSNPEAAKMIQSIRKVGYYLDIG